MVIIGNSGSRKTKLLLKFLLKQYLDLQKIIFVSFSLSQKEYEVIKISLQKGLSIYQIRTLYKEQKHITNIDMALDIITYSDKFKSIKLEVLEFKHPDDIPLSQELNSQGIKNKLVIIDDCTIIKSSNPKQLYVYGRSFNINTI